ncbi:MAG TPA: Panacea domain-containing protein [Verrucomicrobiae bacterium]|jgi:uncharacterized phage-associated protein
MLSFRFNCTKAAQAGAFLLNKAGGSMDKYLFIKMLYIADRESLSKWGEPITGDLPVSMEHGPVLSIIYDLTKGESPGHRASWSPYISDADDQTNQVSLKADPTRDQLSNNEVRILESVYSKFKDYTWKRIKDYCHSFAEYEDVGKSSEPIRIESILKALGKTPEQIAEIEKYRQEMNFTEALLG